MQGSDRSGVALILVVGLLALMMVMAVAFSIYMRTERVAAGNFKSDVKTRQLLYVALNHALQTIESSVGSRSYPPWAVTNSSGYGNAMAITNGSAWGVLPTAAIGTGTTMQAGWEDVNQSGIDGRYAYLIVNASGLLDANYAGGMDRGPGTNVQEVQVVNLSDLLNEATLVNRRPYITQQELAAIGTNSGALRTKPANFVSYSAFPNPTGSLVYVGGDVAELMTNRNAIIAAFTNAGDTRISLQQAGTLFTNLVDYVDADFTPGNLGNPAATGMAEGPAVEPVWMFNEVYASNYLNFAFSGSNYVVSGAVRLSLECIYPFVGGDNSGCTLNYRVLFTNCASGMFVPSVNPLTRVNVPLSGAPVYMTIPHLPPIQGNVAGGVVAALPGSNLVMEARVYAWIEKAGKVVDSVTNSPVVMTWTLPAPVLSGGSNYVTQGSVSYECRDPRLNYRSDQWVRLNNSSTLGTTNAATLSYLTGPIGATRDGDLAMYVANKPVVRVGELGFLFFDNPLETIRLYKHGLLTPGSIHRVLDYFTVDSPSNAVMRGKVHLGTRQREVMMAVYDDMPIDSPGSGANRLSGAILDTVVDAVMAMTSTNTALKLSDLGTVNWGSIYSAGGYPGSTDLDREAFVRNAAGLFGVRQNYFIILLHAQSTKFVPMMADRSVVAGVRAVVEVWRDPVKNTDGRNPIVIRSFKILSE